MKEVIAIILAAPVLYMGIKVICMIWIEGIKEINEIRRANKHNTNQ